MSGRTIYGQKLAGWDVLAALFGLGVTLGFQYVQTASWASILWIGGPATAIFARRRFLPNLSRPSEAQATPPTPMRQIGGYVLMICGGFAMFIDGIFVWAATSARAPLPIAIALGIFAAAGWIATLGFRRVA